MSDYNEDAVRELLPHLWSADRFYGLSNPLAAEGDMPRGTTDPSHGGSWMAHLVDLNTAWQKAPLTSAEMGRTFLYYGAHWEQPEIATHYGVSQQAVALSIGNAVTKLTAYMNGEES